MTIYEEVVAALQAGTGEPPALDARQSRAWQMGLQRALGGAVLDRSDYRGNRYYRFEFSLPATSDRPWFSTLSMTISRFGPFAFYTVYRSFQPDSWWGGRQQTSRRGYTPEDEAAIERLRAWCDETSIRLVDTTTQAMLLPKLDMAKAETTIFRALFQ